MNTFEKMNLKPMLLKGIYSIGFEYPSAIQTKAIPHLLGGKDIIAQGQSGTGKTATFGISSLQIVDENINETQVMILSPTRELAIQTQNVLNNLSNFMDIKIHSLIGGTSVMNDIDNLENRTHIIVGTPGRILHMLEKKHLSFDYLKLIIIDEADEMLEKGFRNQLYQIFQFNLPPNIQFGIFSATMPSDIVELSNKFMTHPEHILIKKEEQTLQGIKQYYIIAKNDDEKQHILMKLYSKITVAQTIIFCNSRRRVDNLASKLSRENFSVSVIHGLLDSKDRQRIINDFTIGKTRILISTNVLARGIDIQGVSFVINFDVTNFEDKETYIHRIGRCGRYGRKGTVINFITEYEIEIINDLCKYYNTQITQLPESFVS